MLTHTRTEKRDVANELNLGHNSTLIDIYYRRASQKSTINRKATKLWQKQAGESLTLRFNVAVFPVDKMHCDAVNHSMNQKVECSHPERSAGLSGNLLLG